MTMAAIETVDLSLLTGPHSPQRAELLQTFVDSCASKGFVKVVGHGISNARLKDVFQWVSCVAFSCSRTCEVLTGSL
jgi:isopenicillin N synthase-like dioxygenase